MANHLGARNGARQQAQGYQFTQAVYVAAKLGIADLLEQGPRSIEDLAAVTVVHGPSLYRLLRALSGFGFFVERPDGQFELGPCGGELKQSAAQTLRSAAILRGEVYYRTWGELLYSIQTGRPAFERVFGLSNWEYRRANPGADAHFNAFMSEMARHRAETVLGAYDFPDGVIVDVGGGLGTLLRAILMRNPGLRGILFDQPHVIERARHEHRDSTAMTRCQMIGGDFFAAIPRGGTSYVLSAVLHDWEDAKATRILQNCRAAMGDTGILLIIERVMPAANEPVPFLSDLDMLVNTGGRERDEWAWMSLLDASGLRLTSIAPTNGDFSILGVRTIDRPAKTERGFERTPGEAH